LDFPPASLILANNYLPFRGTLTFKENMFKSFDKSTITVCCFLGLNCFMAVMSIYLVLFNQDSVLHISNYGKAIISGFMVLANGYLIFYLHKREMMALKLCFWFCLLQIVTIESESLAIGLNYGVKIGAVFEIGVATVSINFLALLTLFFVDRIIRGQKRLTTVEYDKN